MRRLIVGGVVCASFWFAVAVAAAAGGSGWSAANALLPANAGPVPFGDLASISCTSAGNCEAVGGYIDTSLDQRAIVARESGGVWGQATEIGLPAGAATTPGMESVSLSSISCPSVGNCEAVGYYMSSTGAPRPMAVNESGGVWGQPIELAMPAEAAASPFALAELSSVSCASPSNCVAVGMYSAGALGRPAAMVISESGGVWGQASDPVTAPAGASSGEHAFDYLDSISCPSVGNCEAAGVYTAGMGDMEPMIVDRVNGGWHRARQIALPANATVADGIQLASLASVSCGSTGHCAAVGSYFDGTGVVPMALMQTNGAWGQASQVNLPANQSSTGQNGTLAVVSCTSNGNCEAGGSYAATIGNSLAMVVREVNGKWGVATATPSPAGADTSPGSKMAEVFGMSCTSDGGCGAVGEYGSLTDSTATLQAMTLSSILH